MTSDGSVIAWGISDCSRLDYGQAVVPETAKSSVIAIAAGYQHSLALKADGTIIAWRDNHSGQTDVPEHVHEGDIKHGDRGSNDLLHNRWERADNGKYPSRD